jgi:hypothetical protein
MPSEFPHDAAPTSAVVRCVLRHSRDVFELVQVCSNEGWLYARIRARLCKLPSRCGLCHLSVSYAAQTVWRTCVWFCWPWWGRGRMAARGEGRANNRNACLEHAGMDRAAQGTGSASHVRVLSECVGRHPQLRPPLGRQLHQSGSAQRGAQRCRHIPRRNVRS